MIRGVGYTSQSVNGDEGEQSVTLVKPDGTTDNVAATGHGIECTRPDFVWTRAERGEPCKHIRSVIEAGLISTTTTAPAAAIPATVARIRIVSEGLWRLKRLGSTVPTAGP